LSGWQEEIDADGKRTLYWQDELRYNRQDLGATVIKQIVNASRSEDVVRIVCLDERVEEQRQIVMVVKLLNLHLHATRKPSHARTHHLTSIFSGGPGLTGCSLNSAFPYILSIVSCGH